MVEAGEIEYQHFSIIHEISSISVAKSKKKISSSEERCWSHASFMPSSYQPSSFSLALSTSLIIFSYQFKNNFILS